MLRALISWLTKPKPRDPLTVWQEAKAAYDRADARKDKRGKGESYRPLRDAMNRRLASGR